MRRKILATLMSLSMLLSAGVVAAQAADFKDTDSSWAKSQIERWSDYKVVQGNQNGEFMPTKEITRAEAAQVFVNLLGLTEEGDISKFSDIDANAWYASALRKAVAAGVMQGSADGKMMPNDPIERRAYFVMFARAMSLAPQNTTKGAATTADGWSEGYINALTDRGYVKGGDKGVDPTGQIDRASVMALMDQTIAAYCNTDNATLTASANGITLVAAKNVTVSGTAGDLVIAAGAAGGKTTLRDLKTSATVTVEAKADTEVAGSSTITNFVLGEKAASTTLTVLNGSTITNLTSKAANATIAGAGKVENASIEANDNKVTTNGTKVTVATGVTGTTAKGTAVAAGSTTTTSASTSSGGGGGGGSSSRRSSGTTTYDDDGVVRTSSGTRYGSYYRVGDDVVAITLTEDKAQLTRDTLLGKDRFSDYVNADDTVIVTVAKTVEDGDVTISGIDVDTLDIQGGGSESIRFSGGRILGRVLFNALTTPSLKLGAGAEFGTNASVIASSACLVENNGAANLSLPLIIVEKPITLTISIPVLTLKVDTGSESKAEIKLNNGASVTELDANAPVEVSLGESVSAADVTIEKIVASDSVTAPAAVVEEVVVNTNEKITLEGADSADKTKVVATDEYKNTADVTIDGTKVTEIENPSLFDALRSTLGDSLGSVLSFDYDGGAKTKTITASSSTNLGSVTAAIDDTLVNNLAKTLLGNGVTKVKATIDSKFVEATVDNFSLAQFKSEVKDAFGFSGATLVNSIGDVTVECTTAGGTETFKVIFE